MRSRPARRFGEPPAGDDRDDVEVHPPHRRGDDHAEHGDGYDAGVERDLGADADRDDRLAQRDDHDRAVALGEVAGHELPAVGAEQERPARVEHERETPQADLQRPRM